MRGDAIAVGNLNKIACSENLSVERFEDEEAVKGSLGAMNCDRFCSELRCHNESYVNEKQFQYKTI